MTDINKKKLELLINISDQQSQIVYEEVKRKNALNAIDRNNADLNIITALKREVEDSFFQEVSKHQMEISILEMELVKLSQSLSP